MLPDVVVVVDVAQGLVQELLLAGDVHDSWDVKLFVVGAVGALEMGILLWMPLMVLDEAAAEAGDELAQLLDLKPGLTAKLLTVVDGENDLSAFATCRA